MFSVSSAMLVKTSWSSMSERSGPWQLEGGEVDTRISVDSSRAAVVFLHVGRRPSCVCLPLFK